MSNAILKNIYWKVEISQESRPTVNYLAHFGINCCTLKTPHERCKTANVVVIYPFMYLHLTHVQFAAAASDEQMTIHLEDNVDLHQQHGMACQLAMYQMTAPASDPPPSTLPHHPVPDSGYLRSISTRTLRSAGGTRTVLDAWHLYVLFRAVRVILCISRRFTVTWRPIDTPPPVCITSSPFSHVTVGSGRPAMSQQDSQRAPGFSW